MINYEELSMEISKALRHEPEKYGLIIDNNGWVNIDDLIYSLKQKKWNSICIKDLEIMIKNSKKKRHEICSNKIRALYGHSIFVNINKKSTKPPKYLYHGTVKKFIESIKKKGLIPKGRQYVYLSSDIATAIEVAERRNDEPIILIINAEKAFNEGILFYIVEGNIWISNSIPLKYINII